MTTRFIVDSGPLDVEDTDLVVRGNVSLTLPEHPVAGLTSIEFFAEKDFRLHFPELLDVEPLSFREGQAFSVTYTETGWIFADVWGLSPKSLGIVDVTANQEIRSLAVVAQRKRVKEREAHALVLKVATPLAPLAAEHLAARHHPIFAFNPLPVSANTRQIVPQGNRQPQAIIAPTNYACDSNDTSVTVTTAGITVTLPQNPVSGVTSILFQAVQNFSLTAGALAPGLTPADPLAIAAGQSFLANYSGPTLGWELSGTAGPLTPVNSVTATAPITSSGGANPNIAITPATEVAAGSMSAADKLKLDNLSASEVTAVTAGAPLASSGGATPNVTASAFTAATSGLAHVTTASLDVAPFKGDTAGKIPTTNAGATDVAFDFLFGPWTADIVPGASPRTLLASEIMAAVNTSTGAVTVLTPLAQDGASLPTNGQVFCVKPVAASATPITVQANGAGVTVENPSNAGNFGATGLVPGQGSGAWFKYRLSDKKWICMPGSGA